MGGISNIANKVKKAGGGKKPTYSFSPELAHKLFRARDKAFFRVLEEMGVTDSGLRDAKDNLDQAALKRRMELAGITIKTVSHHEDPRNNGIVFFKYGNAVAAISQPFIDNRGNIVVKMVEPKFIIQGVA